LNETIVFPSQINPGRGLFYHVAVLVLSLSLLAIVIMCTGCHVGQTFRADCRRPCLGH